MMQTLVSHRQGHHQSTSSFISKLQSQFIPQLLNLLTPQVLAVGLFCSFIGYLFGHLGTSTSTAFSSSSSTSSFIPHLSLPSPAASSQSQLDALESADLKLYATQRSSMSSVDHLILVAGHAVYIHSDYASQPDLNSHWILESYQTKQVKTFLAHIETGLKMTSTDPNSLLVFTGGFTRSASSASEQSEAQSYLHVARHHFAQLYAPIAERVTSEVTSRDSFENLLHAICRFRERVGRYPYRITAIGFKFKTERFTKLHLKAIRFPPERFNYVGIDSSEWTADDLATVQAGELANSFTPFTNDVMGCHSTLLAKRMKRNPHVRNVQGIAQSCPAISHLMAYCPDEQTRIFTGQLPWSPAIADE